jgi:hypothetical protein
MDVIKQTLLDILQSSNCCICQCAVYGLLALGSLVAVNITWHSLWFFYRNFFQFSTNLSRRYKKGTCAVVTGSSDGIGAEMAVQLAE